MTPTEHRNHAARARVAIREATPKLRGMAYVYDTDTERAEPVHVIAAGDGVFAHEMLTVRRYAVSDYEHGAIVIGDLSVVEAVAVAGVVTGEMVKDAARSEDGVLRMLRAVVEAAPMAPLGRWERMRGRLASVAAVALLAFGVVGCWAEGMGIRACADACERSGQAMRLATPERCECGNVADAGTEEAGR